MLGTYDLSDLGLPIYSPRPIRVNVTSTVTEGIVRPTIASKELNEEFTEITGVTPEDLQLSTRVFEFDLQESDHVVVRAVENNLPLIVCRDEEVIINFDLRATQAFLFSDSKRPIYTHVPGFNIQKVPTAIRRPLSNCVQSVYNRKKGIVANDHSKLLLTGFEFVILLVNRVLARERGNKSRLFQWPSGKRAVFVSLHDVDTGGFLKRGENDPLFRLEEKHDIKAVWFVPTGLLKGDDAAIDFLLQSGNEVGWHGHKHDHRLPFKPFAEQRVSVLKESRLASTANYPLGMRTPKLLKSNYLFDLLERSCPALCYDTSFSQGIVPYYLWLNGRKSRILEIPVTVPTDIGIYNKLQGIPRSAKPEAMLRAQIARTERLMEVGGVISIVTHPEKDLTERPEFLDVYDQYLSYIKSCPDIWFATAGELFKYWTRNNQDSGKQSHCSSKSDSEHKLGREF
jgi:peptidoglycan/xylan/chitin deacetylase (PgdA/CDA1 family)